MQANLIAYEVAEVEFFQKKITFRIVRTTRGELNVRQCTQSKRKYVHVLISYDCV